MSHREWVAAMLELARARLSPGAKARDTLGTVDRTTWCAIPARALGPQREL